MQNKTASILLLAGAASSLISLCIMIFYRGEAEVRPQSFNMLSYMYIAQELVVCSAIISFAILYNKNGLEGLKIPGALFVAGALVSGVYLTFLLNEYVRIGYEVQTKEKLNFFVWAITVVSQLVLGVQLVRNNAYRKFAAWSLFIVGALIAIQSTQGIFRQIAIIFIDNPYISKDLYGLKAILFLVSIGIPVGYLLIAQRTESLGYRNKSTDEVLTDFETGEKSDIYDLLDLPMTKETIVAQHKKEDHNSVLWWLITFIVASIPLIGFGFTVYWSIAKSQVRRGNWAVTYILSTMISILFYTFYFLNKAEIPVKPSNIGLFIIGVILFFGIVAAVCASYNNRNQENISLENYSYAPTVSGWIGYSLLMAVPIVNIICLIVFAVDEKDKYRQTWAQARLLLIPFSLIAVLQYSYIVTLFGRF